MYCVLAGPNRLNHPGLDFQPTYFGIGRRDPCRWDGGTGGIEAEPPHDLAAQRQSQCRFQGHDGGRLGQALPSADQVAIGGVRVGFDQEQYLPLASFYPWSGQ